MEQMEISINPTTTRKMRMTAVGVTLDFSLISLNQCRIPISENCITQTIEYLLENVENLKERSRNMLTIKDDGFIDRNQVAFCNNQFITFMFEVGYVCNFVTELPSQSPLENVDRTTTKDIDSNFCAQSSTTSDSDTNSETKCTFKIPKNKPKNGNFHKRWLNHYEKLKEFKRLHGHTNVTRFMKGHEKLGSWMAYQRRKLRKGKLTRHQFDMLNSLGVEWDWSSQGVSKHNDN
mmetsp:Transcript_16334/g.22655  ORF Transcript_16334/g.22655 Transcript_16334/m.22655 type:complete len:234 (-) Transcript_16334:325-1026(-)|eukprot:CAMPEP_0168552698 /NCGR_PEP_ID=MMETSP0413-20121227/6855_1 /TAXON_ID=136452 /ORGANISM="Filamoeba nolandi, Strain NC-AS-23-1" /LENGTH=233 /DNA_ID=CAMNT_0008583329 /DNA_START=118 /DNA_END=819 /DNA_ORIENTATION=+